jgi:hypothetical protein
MRITHAVVTFALATGLLGFAHAPGTTEPAPVAPTQAGIVVLWSYSAEVHGDWRVSYQQWTPSTIYYHGGQYHRSMVPGARVLMVYSHSGAYFLPPSDRAWAGVDRRYNRELGPNWRDRGRAKSHPSRGRGPR